MRGQQAHRKRPNFLVEPRRFEGSSKVEQVHQFLAIKGAQCRFRQLIDNLNKLLSTQFSPPRNRKNTRQSRTIRQANIEIPSF